MTETVTGKNKRYEQNQMIVLKQLFKAFLPAQIFTILTQLLTSTVSGIVVGNCLGETAMAAIGIAAPVTPVIACISNAVAGGATIVYGRFLGRGEKDGMNRVYSSSVVLAFSFGLLINIVLLLFPRQLAAVLGANEELIQMTAEYIRGLSFNAVPAVLLPVLIAFLNMSNHITYSLLSMLIMAACNLLYGYIATAVLSGGVFGMGIAVSAASYTALLFAFLKFIRHKEMEQLNFRHFSFKTCGQELLTGIPSAVPTGLSAVRNICLFSALAKFGGTAAVEAFAVLGSSTLFADCIYMGWALTTMMIASVLVGEGDTKRLAGFTRMSLTGGALAGVFATALLLALKVPILMVFKVTGVAADYFRSFILLYALCCIPAALGMIIANIYQALERIKLLNIIYTLSFLVIPVASIYVLGPVLGANGVVLSLPVSMTAMCLILCIVVRIRLGRFPKSFADLIWVDDSFEIKDEDKISFAVNKLEAVTGVSKKIQDFCLAKGIDERRSMMSGLCLEEIAGNVIEHGFPKAKQGRDKLMVDIFATAANDKVTLLIRDNAPLFDPNEKLGIQINPDDPMKNVGIRMVKKIADEMNYQTVLGLNTLLIKL